MSGKRPHFELLVSAGSVRRSSPGLHANTLYASYQVYQLTTYTKSLFRGLMQLKSDQWRTSRSFSTRTREKVLWLLCLVLKSMAMLSHKEIPAFSKTNCYSFKPVSAGLLLLSISASPRDTFLCRLSLLSVQTQQSQKPNFLIRQSLPTFHLQPAPVLTVQLLTSNPISTAA